VVQVYRSIFSKRFISYLAAILAIFLTSGGLYVVIMQPSAAIEISSSIEFLIRASVSSMSMTTTEFIAAFFLTLAGAAGFILLDRALRRSFDINSSKMQYLIAISLVVLSVLVFEVLINAKMT
jgi:uncharacterized membrane protein YidH (DUF202 family)